jgi:manganese transport protein
MKPWQHHDALQPLPDGVASVAVPRNAGFVKTLLAYSGPGLMVAVGYMDPGNWATDIAGGARYGYTLLSVVLISSLFAILLQHLALKLGIATGRDLARACRDHYNRPTANVLWLLAEVAIAACDLAEVIGSAIGLNLLFGLPITVGIILTSLDVLLLLMLQHKGFQFLERLVAGLIFLILGCFVYEMVVSRPELSAIVGGLLPRPEIVTTPGMLYVAIGILGATVMPHNLYLHSSIVQTRDYDRTDAGRASAIRFATIDSTVSLFLAFFINAAILILAAAAFHNTGNQNVADITDAYHLLDPVLGVKMAGVVFAVALLASGQNSTLTGTLAGQIVMEGFLNIRLKPWLRRLITRLVAIVPALVVSLLTGGRGTADLLVLSQVVLSLQLSFAVVPLVLFTSDAAKMGRFVNRPWLRGLAWTVAGIIMALNGYLLWDTFF